MPHVEPALANSHLLDWVEVDRLLGPDRVLLLGNGASRAIWSGFAYDSLFAMAKDSRYLGEMDLAVFQEFGTTDFERVLGALTTTRRVAASLGLATRHVDEHYASIQNGLARSVGKSHVEWETVAAQLPTLREHYQKYARLFTTNYDLLLYWAVMYEHPAADGFLDFFWNDSYFDPTNVDVREADSRTQLYYLHGGVHLRKTGDGRSRKRVAADLLSLLDAFNSPISDDETPLLVSEGSTAAKQRAIRESDYLSFAVERFRAEDRSLVIFGQAMGMNDEHIWRGADQEDRLVAVSVHPRGDVRGQKLELAGKLPGVRLLLFDSSSHPLGRPELLLG